MHVTKPLLLTVAIELLLLVHTYHPDAILEGLQVTVNCLVAQAVNNVALLSLKNIHI
jgi:hypothetical protein